MNTDDIDQGEIMSKAEEERNKRKELADKIITEMNRLIDSEDENLNLAVLQAAAKAVNDYLKQKESEKKYRYSGYVPVELLFNKGEW